MGLVVVLLGVACALSATSLVAYARFYAGQRIPVWPGSTVDVAGFELTRGRRRAGAVALGAHLAASSCCIGAAFLWWSALSVGSSLLAVLVVLVVVLVGPQILVAVVHNGRLGPAPAGSGEADPPRGGR